MWNSFYLLLYVFIIAFRGGRLDTVKLLIKKGADVNKGEDSDGRTALFYGNFISYVNKHVE